MKYCREFGLGIGYTFRFNAGDTWELKDNRKITKRAGIRGYLTPSLFFGGGLAMQTVQPAWIFWKLSGTLLTGFNGQFVPDMFFEIGTRISPSWGIKNNYTKRVNKKISRL